MNDRTVMVRMDESYALPIVKMVWNAEVREADVEFAFKQIGDLTSKFTTPFFVVVDLTSNPRMPPPTTVRGALGGVYQNPQLKEWLVIGSNDYARMIENSLWGMTGRHNVRWFDSEEDVRAYLDQLGA